MSFWGRYIPVTERKAKAKKKMEKLRKQGKDIQPIEIEGRTIARSFWGKRWCEHLESFSDYANRLPRGRTYVRNGSICHLEIQAGRIEAIVSGSSLYKISITIKKLSPKAWKSIKKSCFGQIGSLLELLQGKLSDQVMGIMSDPKDGLFPHPDEIALACDCPDWADMCKHVAAVLYGVGHRLDNHPELLFLLRDVDAQDLISSTISLPTAKARDTLAEEKLGDLFDIDIDFDGSATPTKPAVKKKAKASVRKKTVSKPSSPVQKKKVSAVKKKAPRKVVLPTAVKKKVPRKVVLPIVVKKKIPRKIVLPTMVKKKAPRKVVLPIVVKKKAPQKVALPTVVKKKAPRKVVSPTVAKKKAQKMVLPKIRPTGKSITRLREQLGLSAPQLAKQLGVPAASIYRWEKTEGRLVLQARPLAALAALQQRTKK